MRTTLGLLSALFPLLSQAAAADPITVILKQGQSHRITAGDQDVVVKCTSSRNEVQRETPEEKKKEDSPCHVSDFYTNWGNRYFQVWSVQTGTSEPFKKKSAAMDYAVGLVRSGICTRVQDYAY